MSNVSIRSVEQNSKMWAMLHDISEQIVHGPEGFMHTPDKVWHGFRKFTPDEWKVICMHALWKEMKILPTLDGSVVPYGKNWSSRRLLVDQMSQLIELMYAVGAQYDVKFATDKGVIWE